MALKSPAIILLCEEALTMQARAILLGLEPAVAGELARALDEDGHWVSFAPMEGSALSARRVDEAMADIVFCCGTASQLAELAAALRARRYRVPFVVATREPDKALWLDGIDAGASDYCCAPFDRKLVRHILENALLYPRRVAESPQAGMCIAAKSRNGQSIKAGK